MARRSTSDVPLRSSWSERRLAHLLVGAAVGLASGIALFGTGFLSGDPAYWDYLWGDAGSGIAGFRYFVAEDWGFPLLHAEGFNQPDGMNIAFTDSLPILALVAKLLRPLGIDDAQWWGWWYLGLHSTLGASAALAARAWGNRSLIVGGAIALIGVSAPFFIFRTGHPGLAGQFTLLLAWAIVGELRSRSVVARWRLVTAVSAGLAVLALLTHVYLLLGVLAILFGGVADVVVSGRRRWPDAAAWLAGVGSAVFLVAGVMGYFTAGASQVQGYFYYGMHVFGPIVPQGSSLVPGANPLLLVSGSGEAFNWLGVGWWALIVVAVGGSMVDARRRAALWTGLQRHQMSLAAVVVVAGYAITPVIRLWDDDPHDLRTPLGWIVADPGLRRVIWGFALLLGVGVGALLARRLVDRRYWPGLEFVGLVLSAVAVSLLVLPGAVGMITGQFRVASRLFWVVSYGALAVSGGLVGRRVAELRLTPDARSRAAGLTMLAVVCAVLQFKDISVWRQQAGAVIDPTPERQARFDGLAALVSGADRILLEPGLNCSAVLGGEDGALAFQDVGIVASWTRLATDRTYAARQVDEDCVTPVHRTLVSGDVLVVAVPDVTTTELIVIDDAWTCESFDDWLACRP